MEIGLITYTKKTIDVEIKLNNINSIISYNGLKQIRINNKNFILINDIKKCFKTSTLEEEINYYKNQYNEALINTMIEICALNPNFYKQKFDSMSSSDFRLAYIFINLILDENIVILNDITNSLDSENKRKIQLLLKELKKQNKTIIIISNDIEFIHKVSDNILIVEEKLICSGNKYEVFTNESVKEIPNVIKFPQMVKEKLNIKIGYRDEIKDLMKDIYRYVK